MITPALLALALAAGQPQAPEQQRDAAPIVVTGQRLSDLRSALAACIARKCPPNRDVDATLAVAEAEFLNGDYDAAEEVIRASLRRNDRHAKGYPEPVADLWRSQARVQSHGGRDPQAIRSARNVLGTLREGLPQEDHRHLTARLELVEIFTRTGDIRNARQHLHDLERSARAAGRNDVARVAAMRLLRTDYVLQPGHEGPALRQLERLAASEDPAQLFESVSARMFLARVYRERGDLVRSDEMLRRIPRSDTDRRQLLYAPAYRLAEGEQGDGSGSTTGRLPDNYKDAWLDVGYWIEPSGRVSGLEVVRKGASTDWAKPLLTSVRGRLYAASSDSTPSYRLERYTYTAPFDVVTGSRMQQRSRRARVEFLDLTAPGETGRAPDAAVKPQGK